MPGSVRSKALGLGFACTGALVLAGQALAGNGGLAPQPSASPGASSIRDSYFFVSIFAVLVLIGVEGALITLIVKYRRGKRARYADGLQLHGSTRLEILRTVVPVLILATIAGFIFVKLPDIANAPPASAANRDPDQGRGAAVLPDVPLPERRDLGENDDRPRRRRRPRGRLRAPTDVLHAAGGCRSSRARSTRFPAASATPGSRRRPARPRAAPISAGSSTR